MYRKGKRGHTGDERRGSRNEVVVREKAVSKYWEETIPLYHDDYYIVYHGIIRP